MSYVFGCIAMTTIEVTELTTGKYRVFAHSNVFVEIGDKDVKVTCYGVTIASGNIPTLKDGDSIVYNPRYQSIAVCHNPNGTIDDLTNVVSVPYTAYDMDGTVWDMRNCIGCGARSISGCVDQLITMFGLSENDALTMLS